MPAPLPADRVAVWAVAAREKMKIVRVRWHDSVSMSSWQSKDDVNEWFKNGSDVMESVGFLYKKSKKCVVIVQSLHAYDKDTNLGDPMMIPMGCVISIERLKSKFSC